MSYFKLIEYRPNCFNCSSAVAIFCTEVALMDFMGMGIFYSFVISNDFFCRCQYDYLEILSHSSEPRRFCGDKSSELKLLRYESAFNHLTLRFVSDHSHSFPGFFADVHIEETAKNSGL